MEHDDDHFSKVCENIKRYLRYGNYPSETTTNEKRTIRRQSRSFTLSDDGNSLFYHRSRWGEKNVRLRVSREVIQDPSKRRQLMEESHNGGRGHRGRDGMCGIILKKYYWPRVSYDIADYVRQCEVCQTKTTVQKRRIGRLINRAVKQEEELSLTYEEEFDFEDQGDVEEQGEVQEQQLLFEDVQHDQPLSRVLQPEQREHQLQQHLQHPTNRKSSQLGVWEEAGVSIVGPLTETLRGNRYIVMLVDHFSKWSEAAAIPDREEKTLAKFLQSTMLRNGCLERVITDQGKTFNNQTMSSFFAHSNTQHLVSSVAKPNSEVKRLNQTILNCLAQAGNEDGDDWDHHLAHVVFTYNTSPHTTTKYSPFEIMYNRQPRLPLQVERKSQGKADGLNLAYPNEQEVKKVFAQMQKRSARTRETAGNNIEIAEARWKRQRMQGKGDVYEDEEEDEEEDDDEYEEEEEVKAEDDANRLNSVFP